jgi:hypothetical protein
MHTPLTEKPKIELICQWLPETTYPYIKSIGWGFKRYGTEISSWRTYVAYIRSSERVSTYTSNREHLSWAGFQLRTVMGIGTDCIGSCKSNYHSITTAPKLCNTVSIKQKYTIYMQRNWKIKASFLTTFYWLCPPVEMCCYF